MNQPLLFIISVFIVLLLGYLIARRFAHYTLRTKLIIAFLTVALIPLGLLAFSNDQITRKRLTGDANQALLAAASQTATNLDTFINTNLDVIRTEAELPLWSKYLELAPDQRSSSGVDLEVRATLRALSRKTDVSSYALLDRQGLTVMDTFASHIGLPKADRAYFQAPLQSGLPYVSPVEFSPTTGKPSLYFSSPVRNSARNIVGVLRLRYDAAVLQTLVAQSNGLAGPDSFAILFDEYHIRQAAGAAPETRYRTAAPLDPLRLAELKAAHRLPDLPPEDLATQLLDLERNLAKAADHPFFTARDVTTGDKLNQVAVAPLQTRPWLVAFFLPRQVFLAPVQAQTSSTFLFAALIAVVVIAAAVGMGQLLVRPLTRLTAVAQQVAAGNLDVQVPLQAQDETGQLARAFSAMTAQLRDLIGSLEARVAARTQRLAIVAGLGERLSAILDPEALLAEMVNQIKDHFGYYHAHVYLLDEGGERLIVTAGTGQAGAEMKARRHAIPLNAPASLVARAARSGEIVSVANVRQAQDWLPNPRLPDTRSEMAVPIILEGQVVGVLDVQEDEIAGLDEGDASLLRSLANQVAVAIRNARLFNEVETALAEARAAQERYLEQAWQKAKIAPRHGQYHHTHPDAPALAEPALAEAKLQALAQSQPTIVTLTPQVGQAAPHPPLEGRGDQADPQEALVAPITLRDKPIGSLQLHPLSPDQIWTGDDLAIVAAVVDQLAQSAESLRLFEETRGRASREQLIREIADRLRAAPDLERLMAIAAEELGRGLGATHAKLELGLDPEPRGSSNGSSDQPDPGETHDHPH